MRRIWLLPLAALVFAGVMQALRTSAQPLQIDNPGAGLEVNPGPHLFTRIREAGCAAGAPLDRSFTTTVGVTTVPANPARSSLMFQVPASLTGGVWVSPTGTAAANAAGSYFFAAGTTPAPLEAKVIGTGAVSFATTTAAVMLPVTEC